MRGDTVQVRSRDPERITWLTLWNACPKNTNKCSHCERRQQTPHEFVLQRPLAARAVRKVVAISQCFLWNGRSSTSRRETGSDARLPTGSTATTAAGSPTTSRRARSPHKDLPPPAGRAPRHGPNWSSTVQHVDGHDDNGVSHEPTDSPDDDDRVASSVAQIWWSWRLREAVVGRRRAARSRRRQSDR